MVWYHKIAPKFIIEQGKKFLSANMTIYMYGYQQYAWTMHIH